MGYNIAALGQEVKTDNGYLGKPIYCKAVDMGTYDALTKIIAHGISDAEQFTSYNVVTYDSSSGTVWSIGYSTDAVRAFITITDIHLKIQAVDANKSAIAFLYYTKTTDSAGDHTGTSDDVLGLKSYTESISQIDTNSYANFDPGNSWGDFTLSNLNRTSTYTINSAWRTAYLTNPLSSGKYYIEFTLDAYIDYAMFGVGTQASAATSNYLSVVDGTAYNLNGPTDPMIHKNGAEIVTLDPGQFAMSTGDTIGIALDADTGKIWFRINGVWISGDPSAGTGETDTLAAGPYLFGMSAFNSGLITTVNTGYKSFVNSPPSGFSGSYVAGGSILNIDATSGTVHQSVLTANMTVAISNIPDTGSYSFTVELIQDSSGGHTITWPANFDFGTQAVIQNTSPNAKEVYSGYTTDNGTTFKCFKVWESSS